MTAMAQAYRLPQGRPLTAADLEHMPDEGHRYELIDGTLIVTPSPAVPHQVVVGNLHVWLRSVVPDDLRVMLAPLDVTVSEVTVLQPDLLVATREALSGRTMVGIPLLAIEVLSPSTRLVDLNLKRAAFERAGVESYWVVDPEEPSLTAWRLDEGVYRRVAEGSGSDVVGLEHPFAVTLDLGRLLD